MKARHREQVRQTRTPHNEVILVGNVIFAAGQLGRDDARCPGIVPDGPDLLLKGQSRPLRQPPQAVGGTGGHVQLPSGIQQRVNTLGGKGGQAGIRHLFGIVPLGRTRHGIARLQRQQRFIAVQHRFGKGMAVQPDRHPRAVVRFPRFAADHAGEGQLLSALVQHRLLYPMLIAGEIQQRRRQRRADQRTAAFVSQTLTQEERRNHQCQQHRRGRKPPAALRLQCRRQRTHREGERQDRQCPHERSPLSASKVPLL